MFITLLGCILIIVVFYWLCMGEYNYWASKEVKYDEAVPFFGSIGNVYAKKLCFSEYIKELYQKYENEKFVGFFFTHGINALVVRDPELIKQILVKDFKYFYPRALNRYTMKTEPMLKNLFFADGDTWKLLRQKLTSAFTVNKLKTMFPLIAERTEFLKLAIANKESGCEVDVQNLMSRYTIDVIGACGFGINSVTLMDGTSQFQHLGKRMLSSTERDAYVAFLKFISPEMYENMFFVPPDVEKGVYDLVTSIMRERNYKPSGRNDFIDILLELKMGGAMEDESLQKKNPEGTPDAEIVNLELNDQLMAAQVFMFFAAGFETSSLAASYTLYQLSVHQDKQIKCQQEIDEVLFRNNGILSYEAVKDMKYLQMCFKESIRMLPPMGFLIRQCAKTYTFPGTRVQIDAGVFVLVSVLGLHNDEKYFEAPEQFRPERFADGTSGSDVYLPYGDGPRACTGQQLGQMQSVAGLAALLSQNSVSPSPNTHIPRIDPSSFITHKIEGGLPLCLSRRLVLERSKPKNEKQFSGIRLTDRLFKKKIRLDKLPST